MDRKGRGRLRHHGTRDEGAAATAIDLGAMLDGLRRVSDVYEELEEVAERRRLLETCLSRLVVRPGAVELHVPDYRTMVVRLDGAQEEAGEAEAGRRGRRGAATGGIQRKIS